MQDLEKTMSSLKSSTMQKTALQTNDKSERKTEVLDFSQKDSKQYSKAKIVLPQDGFRNSLKTSTTYLQNVLKRMHLTTAASTLTRQPLPPIFETSTIEPRKLLSSNMARRHLQTRQPTSPASNAP